MATRTRSNGVRRIDRRLSRALTEVCLIVMPSTNLASRWRERPDLARRSACRGRLYLLSVSDHLGGCRLPHLPHCSTPSASAGVPVVGPRCPGSGISKIPWWDLALPPSKGRIDGVDGGSRDAVVQF